MENLDAIAHWAAERPSQRNLYVAFGNANKIASGRKLLEFIRDKTACLVYLLTDFRNFCPWESDQPDKIRFLCENGGADMVSALDRVVGDVDVPATKTLLQAWTFSSADLKRALRMAMSGDNHESIVDLLGAAAFRPSA